MNQTNTNQVGDLPQGLAVLPWLLGFSLCLGAACSRPAIVCGISVSGRLIEVRPPAGMAAGSSWATYGGDSDHRRNLRFLYTDCNGWGSGCFRVTSCWAVYFRGGKYPVVEHIEDIGPVRF